MNLRIHGFVLTLPARPKLSPSSVGERPDRLQLSPETPFAFAPNIVAANGIR
jgi:hypothetical protein